MSYNYIPMASAKPIANNDDNNNGATDEEPDIVVVQAHVDGNDVFGYNYNNNSNITYPPTSEPTIAVPASMVEPAPAAKPQQSTQQASMPSYPYHYNSTQVHPTASTSSASTDPRIVAFKQRRKRRQALAAATGLVAGTILVGPVIGVVTGAVAHGVVKSTGRRRQRRLQEQLGQQQPQEAMWH